MSIITAPAPITHSGAQPFSIDLQKTFGSIAGDVCEVYIANLSAVNLGVTIGDRTYPLHAGVANVFPIRNRNTFQIAPRATGTSATGIPATTDMLVLELAIATEGDQIPGTYPAVVVANANGIPLGTLIMPTNISPSLLRVARPPGINYLRLNVFAGDVLSLLVVGEQTNTTYLSITEPGMGSWFSGVAGCEITEAADTSLAISAQVSASHTCSIRISGYFSEDSAPIIRRAQIAPTQSLTAASNAGQAIVSGIPDTSAFTPGCVVLLAKFDGTFVQRGIVQVVAATSVTLNANLSAALAIFDTIQLLPATALGDLRGTWAASTVTIAASGATQLVAANANRRGLIIVPNGLVNLSLHGLVPVIAQVPTSGYWEMPMPITSLAIDASNLVGSAFGVHVHEIT